MTKDCCEENSIHRFASSQTDIHSSQSFDIYSNFYILIKY